MVNETERCLVDHTGSCTRCGVLTIVLEKSRGAEPLERVRLAERVRGALCPDGDKMIVPPRVRTEQSIW